MPRCPYCNKCPYVTDCPSFHTHVKSCKKSFISGREKERADNDAAKEKLTQCYDEQNVAAARLAKSSASWSYEDKIALDNMMSTINKTKEAQKDLHNLCATTINLMDKKIDTMSDMLADKIDHIGDQISQENAEIKDQLRQGAADINDSLQELKDQNLGLATMVLNFAESSGSYASMGPTSWISEIKNIQEMPAADFHDFGMIEKGMETIFANDDFRQFHNSATRTERIYAQQFLEDIVRLLCAKLREIGQHKNAQKLNRYLQIDGAAKRLRT